MFSEGFGLSTRFECVFAIFLTRSECNFQNIEQLSTRHSVKVEVVQGTKTTLETSGEDVKLHSKRVEKM